MGSALAAIPVLPKSFIQIHQLVLLNSTNQPKAPLAEVLICMTQEDGQKAYSSSNSYPLKQKVLFNCLTDSYAKVNNPVIYCLLIMKL